MTVASVSTDRPGESWDLFCRVVDNFGDIGIAWRLARQIAADPHRIVRLIVDGLESFAWIEPRLEPWRERQTIDRIEIVRWPADELGIGTTAEIVIELLGCGLPAGYLDAMERTTRSMRLAPVWIDFEHLSAESWVADFHGLPSPHPTRPLVKHFFYPGFDDRTGGLLIEPGLAERRAAFVGDAEAVDSFWRRLAVPPRIDRELRLSLFAYADAPVTALLAFLADAADRPCTIFVPDGVTDAAIARFIDGDDRTVARRRGELTVTTVPFVDQDAYDRLLWACDINFVRGEDSFVRAQAAGRPFVWQIYKQLDAAHLPKLLAFEDLYEVDLPAHARRAQRALWRAWNNATSELASALAEWLAVQTALRMHAERWSWRADAPLIDRLLAFVAARRRPSNASHLLD